jgi:putative tryptophan/tyrosine transport system substrate-binding protein
MDRRRFLLTSLAGALAAPLVTEGQQAGKVYRIGLLENVLSTELLSAVSAGLRERGWVEGQNFVWERRFSEGRNERFPGLAAELVQGKPDIIITAGTAATLAAKAVTTTIPIVFHSVGDPVGSGIVASLGRPGGNVTGVGGLGPGLHAKMLELLKEAVPRASRIGLFVNPAFGLHTVYRNEIEPVATKINVTLVPIEIRAPEQLDDAFATAVNRKLDGLMLLGQPMMFVFRNQVAKLALAHRIPAIIYWSEAVEAGVFMSYGERTIDYMQRVPHYVDRILRGANPSELPVEQSTRFYLSINLKTAKALGLTIPPSLLARADQVIE